MRVPQGFTSDREGFTSNCGVFGDIAFDLWEFRKLGVPYSGVLIIRILLFGVLY